MLNVSKFTGLDTHRAGISVSNIGSNRWSFNPSSIVYVGDGGYLLNIADGTVYGSFAVNSIPYFLRAGDSKTYFRGEASFANAFPYSQAFNSWSTASRISVTTSQTDPCGSTTACKLIPNTDNNYHYLLQSAVYGAGTRIQSLYVKQNGYNCISMTMSGVWGVDYNLSTLTSTVSGGSVTAKGIESLSGSWYRIWAYRTGLGAGSANTVLTVGNNDVYSFVGDGTSGVDAWQQEGNFTSIIYTPSPIYTNGPGVTRAADVTHFNSANIPSGFLNLPSTIKAIPLWAHNSDTNNHVLFSFDANNYLWWDGTNKKIVVTVGGATKVQSGALTHARGAVVSITMTPSTGTLTTSGFASGNGTVVDTAWAWPSATDLYFGCSSAGATHWDGCYTLPEQVI